MSGTWKVKIDDGFCEHEFTMRGRADVCINDLLRVVAERLDADRIESRLTRSYATMRLDRAEVKGGAS